MIPEGYKLCPECEGAKVRVYSCCTGEHVDNDFMMCPTCHEHLGEEDCMTCEGKGWSGTDTKDDLRNRSRTPF